MTRIFTFQVRSHQFKTARVIKVAAMATLFQLHQRIAKTFDDFEDDIDWGDTTHLHEFVLPKQRGGVHYYDPQMFEGAHPLGVTNEEALFDVNGQARDDSKIAVGELRLQLGDILEYIYDFGAEWTFKLKLKKVEEAPLQV